MSLFWSVAVIFYVLSYYMEWTYDCVNYEPYWYGQYFVYPYDPPECLKADTYYSVVEFCYFICVIVGMTYRARLRLQYGLYGNRCDDCLSWWFCPPCSVIQEAAFVDTRSGIAL